MTHHLEIVERVKSLPARVAREIEGLSEDELRWRPGEGQWSLKEVCGHLRDDSEVWRQRLYMMITQTDPLLPRYDQEALVREHGYQDADFAALLGDFKRLRLEIAGHLAALARDNWKQTGRHREWGRMTVRQGMEMMIGHTEGHLEQIRELREGIATGRANPAPAR